MNVCVVELCSLSGRSIIKSCARTRRRIKLSFGGEVDREESFQMSY